MNNVSLVGKMVRDIDLKFANSGTAIGKFSLAVNRDRKNDQGKYEADFINCVAFGKTAEILSNYAGKGKTIGVIGRIQTGSYEKEEKKVYTTDVMVEKAQILDWGDKKDKPTNNDNDNFQLVNDEDIPF